MTKEAPHGGDIPKTTRGLPIISAEQGGAILKPYQAQPEQLPSKLATIRKRFDNVDPNDSGLGWFLSGNMAAHPQPYHEAMYNAAAIVLMGIETKMPTPKVSEESIRALFDEMISENSSGERFGGAVDVLLKESPGLGVLVDVVRDAHPEVPMEPIFEAAAVVIVSLEHQIAADKGGSL